LYLKKAVIFVGMPGSGKSMGTRVATDLKIPIIVMGDIVRAEATKRGISHSPQNLGKLMLELRKEYGPSVVADRVLEEIEKIDSLLVVIDGARSEVEIKQFKKALDDVIVVAIHSSPQTRFQRLIKRRRADDALNWEVFVERDSRELGVGIGDIIAKADIMLINERDPNKLRREISKILTGAMACKET
jgi:dephospho-CoA kinase